MTHCIHRNRLSDYLDGDLAPEQAAEVRRHLETDPPCGCRQVLTSLEQMVRELGGLEPGPVLPGGWARLEASLESADRGGRLAWRYPAWAAAALIVAAGLAGALALRGTFGPVGTDAPAPAEPPRLLGAVAGAELPPVRIPEELLVRYGVEIRPLDRLIAALREVPEGKGDDDEGRRQIEQLTELRADLLAELVLQAQASDAAPWQ